ncbi:class II aldolase/adducin family protein [Candidatus Omnitrophota bacterium]
MSKRLSTQKRIKEQLVEYGRRIAAAGMVIGSGGNISVRYRDVVFIKARDVNMVKAGTEDYIAIDLGKGKFPHKTDAVSSEYRMHILCYKARPDISCVIHVHPVFSVALSSKIRSLQSCDYEFSVHLGSPVRVIPNLPSGSLALARAVSRAITQANCVLLKNHGLTCVGKGLDEAYLRCQAVERASQIHILKRRL